MVEYRALSTFVSRCLNTDLKDFTFDLWKKRGKNSQDLLR